MKDIAETLFLHAVENNFHPYLDIPAYRHYVREEEKAEASIQKLLPPEGIKLLDEMHQYRVLAVTAEQEAAFRAGLAIALELSRL